MNPTGLHALVVLRELRMHQAAKLLQAGMLTIDQVARAVGYNSRSSFSRAFRQARGAERKVHGDTESPSSVGQTSS